jgi:hypothetical protein
VYDLQFLQENMIVIPVKEHKNLLAHCKEILEYQQSLMAIHHRFNKLITSLRTADVKSDGTLDKEATTHDDLMDTLILTLFFRR